MSTQLTHEETVKREIRQMAQMRGVEETMDCIREAEEEITSKDEPDEFETVDDVPFRPSVTPQYNKVRIGRSGHCHYRGEVVWADEIIDKDIPLWIEGRGEIDRDDVRLGRGGIIFELVDKNED